MNSRRTLFRALKWRVNAGGMQSSAYACWRDLSCRTKWIGWQEGVCIAKQRQSTRSMASVNLCRCVPTGGLWYVHWLIRCTVNDVNRQVQITLPTKSRSALIRFEAERNKHKWILNIRSNEQKCQCGYYYNMITSGRRTLTQKVKYIGDGCFRLNGKWRRNQRVGEPASKIWNGNLI